METQSNGLKSAQDLLQKVRHQLLYGDSPPGNELHQLHQHQQDLHKRHKAAVGSAANGNYHQILSRQRHDVNLPPSNYLTLSSTTCAVLHNVLEQRGWKANNNSRLNSLSRSNSTVASNDQSTLSRNHHDEVKIRTDTEPDYSIQETVSEFVENLLVATESPLMPSTTVDSKDEGTADGTSPDINRRLFLNRNDDQEEDLEDDDATSCIAKVESKSQHEMYLQFEPPVNEDQPTLPPPPPVNQKVAAVPLNDLLNRKSVHVMGHDNLVQWMQNVEQEESQQLQLKQQHHQQHISPSTASSSRPSNFPSPQEHLHPSPFNMFASPRNPYSPESPDSRQGPMLVPTYAASISSYEVSSSSGAESSESDTESEGVATDVEDVVPDAITTMPSAEQPPPQSNSQSLPSVQATPQNVGAVKPKGVLKNAIKVAPATPTLQMFGSEYARFLSQTPFTPNIPMGKKKGTPIRLTKSSGRPSRLAATTSGHHHHAAVSTPLTESKSADDDQGGWLTPDFPPLPTSQSMPTPTSAPRPGRPPTHVMSAAKHNPFVLENASEDVLGGAILDICVTYGSEMPPPAKDYYRIAYTSTGKLANLNNNGMSLVDDTTPTSIPVFLNVKKEPNWSRAVQRPCIVSLVVIFPDRNEFVPPGYCVVKRYKHKPGGGRDTSLPANLNYGRSNSSALVASSAHTPHGHRSSNNTVERVYLCYKRSREGNPITGIVPLLPSERECIPPGYTVLERSPRNYVANVNEGAGPPVFLAVRQRLASLESARPDPLLKFQLSSIVNVAQANAGKPPEQKKRAINGLYGYYATGGTVVASGTIGKLHVMDRMAHPRFSPSSMATRMTLAYKSPAKGEFQPLYQNEARTTLLMHRHASKVSSGGGPYFSDVDSNSGYSVSTFSTSASETIILKNSVTHQTATTQNSESSSCVGGAPQPSNFWANHPFLLQDADSMPRDSISMSFELKSLASDLSHTMSMNEGDFATAFNDEEPLPLSSSAWQDETDSASKASGPVEPLTKVEMLRLCNTALDFIPAVTSTGHLGAIGFVDYTLENRISVLTPILTACYNYHGGSALLAVEGLTNLLVHSDFFLADVIDISGTSQRHKRKSPMESPLLCPDLTLLDLTLQTVCDVATYTSREIYFSSCIQFCVEALRYAKRHGGSITRLHSRTIGYVLRLHLFVFSFGTSIQSPKGRRVAASDTRKPDDTPTEDGIHGKSEDIPLLRDEPVTEFFGVEATELAASALRELASLVVEDVLPCRAKSKQAEKSSSNGLDLEAWMTNIVLEMADETADRVNASNLLQLATHQIHRGGGSELFWYDMTTSCGLSLFDGTSNASNTEYIMGFALLACFTKAASGGIRRTQGEMFVPRDISTKLLSLELLSHFIQKLFPHDKNSDQPAGLLLSQGDIQLVYAMRRLVVPCIIGNTSLSQEDPRTFRRCIVIINSFLTKPSYRKHLKIELGVLIDLYVLFLLRPGPRFSRAMGFCRCVQFEQQVDALSLVGHWLGNRTLLVEMFYNFDAENEDTASWNFAATKKDIVGQLFAVLCTLSGKSSKVISDNLCRKEDPTRPITTFLSVDEKDRLVQASRALQFLAMSAMRNAMRSLKQLARECSQNKRVPSSTPQTYSQLAVDNGLAKSGLTAAFDILAAKGLKKAIEYLIACNILTPSPRDIATFLRVHQHSLPPHILGDFLGEGSDSISDHWDMIRYHYVRAISFVDLNVEEALRHFLQHCGFHLPGEAQRIERIIATFAQTYFEDNVGDYGRCPFQQQDTVFLLAYAIIMLNTDLHKAPDTKNHNGRKRKKMTQQEFRDNLKRAVPGEELPKDYVNEIYDSIEAEPMAINGSKSPADSSKAVYVPLRQSSLKQSGSDDASSDRSSIPIEQMEINLPLANAIKTSQELLRGLSLEEHLFFMSKDEFEVSSETIESIMTCSWFHFHDIVKSVLETPQPSRDILLTCLDTVHATLSCIILCDLQVGWHLSFVKLLAQIKFFMDRMDMMYECAHSDLKRFIVKDDYSKYHWYNEIRDFFEAKERDRLSRARMRKTLDNLVQSWRQTMQKQLDPTAVIQLDRVSRRIRNGASLVKKGDSSRLFLREGNLVKHCSNGQKKVYRFFLFSDRLLYGHKSSAHGDYKIHAELPLSAMKVGDLHRTKYAESFQIIHPTKTFTVSAHNPALKASWMEDLRSAIQKSINVGVQ